LIIGGTGALGKTLVSKYYNDSEIIVMSRDEHKHFHMKQIYPSVKYIVGDVRDKDSVINVLVRYNPEVVINAAALKHVHICEENPWESVKTNIIGHQNVIEAVQQYPVEHLIFVSTDKACKPINVYGMCKSISEQLYMSMSKLPNDIQIKLVRYGNVLESTGSVIPFFKKLLDNEETTFLPITDMKMTRFLLSLDTAVELIENAYNDSNAHGHIAIPKVKSLKIIDVAKCLINEYRKDDGITLEEVGIREGEKLHEEMISTEEWIRTQEFDYAYLIGHEQVRQAENWSFNSKDSLMSSGVTREFLKNNKVI
jgi:UDP-N-acetylglucosamine 4,6-dehydratase